MTDYFHLAASREAIGQISSLGLAHLGDAVYELMTRDKKAENDEPDWEA